MKTLATLSAALALAAGSFALAPSVARAEDKVDFAKQIVPIMKESCFKCHSAEKQKGKLALHTPDAITKGSKEGPVVVKGDPDKSSFYKRVILPPKDDDVMPPEDEGKHLTTEQTTLIANWIKQGADFGDWKGEAAGAGGTAAGAVKEIALPQVPPADGGAMDKLKGTGALVLPLAQGINLLDVSFISGADKVADGDLANLAPIGQQIFALNLASTKITDGGLASIEKLPNLRILHLEKTAITDAGLAHVKGLATLEYLNLYGTQVTDAGLSNLEGLKNLKHVYLWQSKVTDAGADKLRKALPNAKIDNGWKDAAPAAPAAAAAPAPTPAPAAPAAAATPAPDKK